MAERIVERGEFALWYVPRSGVGTATEVTDVDELGMILLPDAEEVCSLLHFASTRLPPLLAGPWQERTAQVAAVDRDVQALVHCLERLDAPQLLRAQRGGARLVAEGRYALWLDDDGEGHFAYRLVVPATPERPQSDLGLRREADYLLAVRLRATDPTFGPPTGGQLRVLGAELQFGAGGLALPDTVLTALSLPEQSPTAADLARAFGFEAEPWRAEPAVAGRWH